MKRIIIITITTALVIVAVNSVFAFGQGKGMIGGCGCWNIPPANPELAQKYSEFQNLTLPLRQKMIALRVDLANLYSQNNPDWNAITQKQKEIAELRVEIQKRARELGISSCWQNTRGAFMKGAGSGYCLSQFRGF
ncbi:MAG: hypothetical protein N3A59_07800 [Thermodesulfovibrionales bacterium]|nr:hypothetical protein [Thermodesulfovibrionales bacterium]